MVEYIYWSGADPRTKTMTKENRERLEWLTDPKRNPDTVENPFIKAHETRALRPEHGGNLVNRALKRTIEYWKDPSLLYTDLIQPIALPDKEESYDQNHDVTQAVPRPELLERMETPVECRILGIDSLVLTKGQSPIRNRVEKGTGLASLVHDNFVPVIIKQNL